MAFRAARATLLFHREPTGALGSPEEDRPSGRRLDAVGAVSVLGAMVEQRRRSQPPPPLDLDLDLDEDDDVPDESQQRPIIEKKSIGFMKIR